jgi:hypothetical protein
MYEDWVIPLIAVVLILVLVGAVIFYSRRDQIPPVKAAKLKCPVGTCPTNISNGVKRCPENDKEEAEYDAATEVCNSKYACDHTGTPYAVLPNQSTVTLGAGKGKCAPGDVCRCMKSPQCAQYVTTRFEAVGGSPFTFQQGTTLTYVQSATYTVPYGEGNDSYQALRSTPPIVLNEPGTQFCTIGSGARSLVYPSTCVKGVMAAILDNEGRPLRFPELACTQELISCPQGQMMGISEDGKIVKCVPLG